VEVVASLSQGRTASAQCGLFTYKSVPVIFEPPCIMKNEGLVNKEFVSIFSTTFFVSETFLIIRRTQRDMLLNVYWSCCQVPVILVRF